MKKCKHIDGVKRPLTNLFENLKDILDQAIFRTCKLIIAGRDTLFPKGSGLPIRSHIIELKPFNKLRVKRWEVVDKIGGTAYIIPNNLDKVKSTSMVPGIR
jgi:hypothetical protein